MPSDTLTKILIVDDHEIVLKELVMLISRQEDLVVAGGRDRRRKRWKRHVNLLPTWW